MEVPVFLIQLALILFSARLLGELASYLHISPVIGELLAGILIGPSVLGLIDMSPPIHLLAQIGIILLLFEVGMETDVGRLTASGLKVLLVALAGIVFPFLSGFCMSYYVFDFSLLTSLFIGSTLTATSIGVTLRVLRDLKKQDSHEAQLIIGAAVLDNIIGIIFLSILYDFSISGEINLWSASKDLIAISSFFLISPLAVKAISFVIKKWDERNEIPGFLPTTMIALILLFAWIAYKIGAPELLGGFVVGLALSRQFFFPFATFLQQAPELTRRIQKEMKPITHLLTPIFFVGIGLSLDLKTVNWESSIIWTLTALLFLVAILGKFLSGFLLIKERYKTQFIVGTAMVPRGEVGLIFANVGLTVGVFKNDIYASLILVIALTTLLAPTALKSIYRKAA